MAFLIVWSLEWLTQRSDLLSQLIGYGPKLCQWTLPLGPWRELDAALICGINLPADSFKQMFIDTGLIHLLVVSGSHLLFLEFWLQRLPRQVQLALMSLYCLLVGLQAPVMRALLRRILSRPLSARLGLTSLQLEAATIVAALLIYPPWWDSRSFLMSWMCGLALCTPRLGLGPPPLELALKSYVFLLPFSWSAPISIAWNAGLAPLVGDLLFPARLVTVAIPILASFTDSLWLGFIWILRHGPQMAPLNEFIETKVLFLWPTGVHIFLLIGEIKWRRASAFS